MEKLKALIESVKVNEQNEAEDVIAMLVAAGTDANLVDRVKALITPAA